MLGLLFYFLPTWCCFDKEYAEGDQEVLEKSLSTKDISLKSRKSYNPCQNTMPNRHAKYEDN